MRKWLLGAFLGGIVLALAGHAWGQIVSAFPFQLQNNTVADATQVMANFNNLLTGINANAAKNGANSDITALLGLTTPLAPSVGGTSTWVGGTSGGSANAQTVTPVVPATFTLAIGNRVVFKAGFSNTNATTLNVAGTGAVTFTRPTQLGLANLAAGDINSGYMISAVYTGAVWQLEGPFTFVGHILDWPNATAPAGYLVADGTCVAQATYPALFTVLSTNWGTCGAGLFALPDYNGRTGVGKDATGRITTACAGANTLTTGCGAQNQTIAQANFPSVNFVVTDNRTWITAGNVVQNGGAPFATTTGGASWVSTTMAVNPVGTAPVAASGGSGTALTTLPPVLVVNKLIKW